MLLKEMQDMDKFVQNPITGPSVINEVSKLKNQDQLWAGGPKSDESLAEVNQTVLKFIEIFAQRLQLFVLVLATIAKS